MKLTRATMEAADLLHAYLCRWNHTDGCGWTYGSWVEVPLRGSRQKYYDKADRLIAAGFDVAQLIEDHKKLTGILESES